MADIIYQSKSRARKDYGCDASNFVQEALEFEFTFSEKREIVKARQNKWRIKKGELYIRQFNKDHGDTWVFRAIPSIHEICIKYDLYPEN